MTTPADISATDLIDQLRSTAEALVSIADALELRVGRCGAHKNGTTCGLLPTHKGYHVSPDGSEMWLDD